MLYIGSFFASCNECTTILYNIYIFKKSMNSLIDSLNLKTCELTSDSLALVSVSKLCVGDAGYW